jgi:uncharacterized protein (DUF1330 family)
MADTALPEEFTIKNHALLVSRAKRRRVGGSRRTRVGRQTVNEQHGETDMAKAYWVATYRSISNPDALAAYAKVAGTALQKAGGLILVRGEPAKTYEAGLKKRTVVLEFDSVQDAQDAYNSPDYQEALRLLDKGAERDIRIVEGA